MVRGAYYGPTVDLGGMYPANPPNQPTLPDPAQVPPPPTSKVASGQRLVGGGGSWRLEPRSRPPPPPPRPPGAARLILLWVEVREDSFLVSMLA